MVVLTNLTEDGMIINKFRKNVDSTKAADVIVEAGLDWTVSKGQLTRLGHNGVTRTSKSVSLVRDDLDLELAVVGNRYSPYQNKDAFDILDPLVEAGLISFNSAGCIAEGERTFIMAKVVGCSEFVNGQDIDLYILATNSHGYAAVSFGFIPVVRQTGRTLAGLGGNVKLTHKGNIKRKMKSLADAMDLAKGKFVASVQQMEEMQSIGMNSAAFQELVKVVIGANGKTDAGQRKLAKILAHGAQVENVLDAYMAMSDYLNSTDAGRNPDSILTSLWYGSGKATMQNMFQKCLEIIKEVNHDTESVGSNL